MRPAKFKKKLGTRVTNADMIKFQDTFSARMSGDMDGLKRKRADAKDKVLPPPSPAFSPAHYVDQGKADKRDKSAAGGKK